MSCGLDHDVNGLPNEFKVEPIEVNVAIDHGFQEMSNLCNQRYGHNTEESNECFEDMLTFYDSELSIDTENIKGYCQDTYETNEEVIGCQQDLLELLKVNV